MSSFEKPNSEKRINQDHLAGVRHRTKYGVYKVINVLKHGVCRFVLQAPVGIAALEHLKSQLKVQDRTRKQKAPNQHHLIAFSGELAVTTKHN